MKILTGSLRGRLIQFKPNPHLRPTADKTRKAIFDMLQGAVAGRRALDLFAGTGALGIEALSSGALSVVFVENERAQARTIEENLKALVLTDRSEVLVADAVAVIQRFSKEEKKFDLVLMDPPYEEGLGSRALAALAATEILSSEALVIFECRESEALGSADRLECIKDKVYGDTRIVIYRRVS